MSRTDAHYPDADMLAAIAPHLGGRSFDDIWQEFEQTGYCVFENVLTQDTLDRVRGALAPHFEKQLYGRNDFEGLKSFRQYSLLSKGAVFS